MRWLKRFARVLVFVAAALALDACARQDDGARFAVNQAAVSGGVLSAQLDWRPKEVLLDGLDHGIPLVFEITLEAQVSGRFGWQADVARQSWRRELRYFPLTRQYQLRDPDRPRDATETRSYPVRAYLIAALSDLRLPLDAAMTAAAAQRYVLRIDLERDSLPGALRLPALIDADWSLSTGNYAWPARSGAG